jgi:hypothetical protein
MPFSFTGSFLVGDVVQVIASQNTLSPQTVLPTSYFSMILTGATAAPTAALVDEITSTQNFTAATGLSALTVVQIRQPDGEARPIDPFIPLVTNIAINGAGTQVTVTVAATYNFYVGQFNPVVFSGLHLAAFLNGQVGTISSISSANTFVVQLVTPTAPVNYNYTTSPPSTEVGSVLYAIDDTGVVLAPLPDGITTTSATAGGQVSVAAQYGGLFSVASANLIVGGLLYAGLGGIITQNFTDLLNGGGSPPAGPVGWIVCVGRAISTTEFIYEPHLPTRFASFF